MDETPSNYIQEQETELPLQTPAINSAGDPNNTQETEHPLQTPVPISSGDPNNIQETELPIQTPAINSAGDGDPSPRSINSSGATAETGVGAEPATKRQRGRPPGSKNKPKPAPLVHMYPSDALRVRLVEVPSGADVNAYLIALARERHASLIVLHGAGFLSSVSFSHTGPLKATAGGFSIISLRGTIVGDEHIGAPSGLSLAVLESGSAERAGVVNGPIVASGSVFVTVGSFSVSIVDRLPFDLPGSGYNRVYGNINMAMLNYAGGGHSGSFRYGSFPPPQHNGGT